MAFGPGEKIGDGYVEIHATIDDNEVRAAARRVADTAADEAEKEGKRRSGGFWKNLLSSGWKDLTTESIKVPFTNALVSPITAAALGLAAIFASTFIGAVVTTFATAGLGGILIAAGAAALIGWNDKVHKAAVTWFDDLKKVATDVAEPLTKPLLAALDTIDKGFKALAPNLKSIFAGLAPAIKPLTDGLMGLVRNTLPGIQRALPGINAVFTAMGRALPILGTAIGDFFAELAKDPALLERATGLIFRFFDDLLKILGPVLEKSTVLFSGFVNWLKLSGDMFGSWADAFANWAKRNNDNLTPLSKLGDALRNFWFDLQVAWAAFRSFAEADDDKTIAQRWTTFWQTLQTTFGAALTVIKELWNAVWAEIKKIWAEKVEPWLKQEISALLDYLISLVEKKLDELKLKAIHKAAEFAQGILDSIAELPAKVGLVFEQIPGRVLAALASLGGMLLAIGANAIDSLLAGARSKLGGIAVLFAGIPGAIAGALAGLPGQLFSAGANAIQGFIDGLGSRKGTVGSVAAAAAAVAEQQIRNNLKIKSPSKVFEQLGKMTMQGFINGIKSMTPVLNVQMAGITNGLTSPSYAPLTNNTSNSHTVNIYGGITVNTQATNGAEVADAVTTRLNSVVNHY